MSQNFWATTGGVIGCVKIFFEYSLIAMQGLVTVSHTVCTRAEGPKEFLER